MGQCQTIIPKNGTECTWKSCGYSFLLRHENIENVENSDSDMMPAGWHMFIHEPKEKFAGKCFFLTIFLIFSFIVT